jgi:hypothetical protein
MARRHPAIIVRSFFFFGEKTGMEATTIKNKNKN